MDDHELLSGRLTTGWNIPPYAQGALWLDSESGSVQVQGPQGLFSLPGPGPLLTLRWGDEHGPALAQLRWQAGGPGWDGRVMVGGYVAALHVAALPGAEASFALVYVEGQPLRVGYAPYPDAAARERAPYPAPDFDEGLDETAGVDLTTWLAAPENPLVALLKDAMLADQRVYLFGRLAEEQEGWHYYAALPLLLDGLTLFGG